MTGDEKKTIVNKQYEQDELKALQLLGPIHSESAAFIEKLQLPKEDITTVLSVLRAKHDGQINLIGILNETRFKTHFHGFLVPTSCRSKHYSGICGKEDTFAHLLDCYGLRRKLVKGSAAMDFLIEMARRTVTSEPGKAAPTYVISKKKSDEQSVKLGCSFAMESGWLVNGLLWRK